MYSQSIKNEQMEAPYILNQVDFQEIRSLIPSTNIYNNILIDISDNPFNGDARIILVSTIEHPNLPFCKNF